MFSYINRIWLCSLLLTALCLLAWLLHPRKSIATISPIRLEQVIPKAFGDWRVDTSVVPLEISPELQAKLSSTYDQTLSRTYINSQGYRIMLSVAYGGNQSSDSTQVHRPEFCYTAQGFEIVESHNSELNITGYHLPIRQLVAVLKDRVEPITYWVTVGYQATQPGIGRKLLQLKYGMSGEVPDGVLVRVSSIDQDIRTAYNMQGRYIKELNMAIFGENRSRLFGSSE